VKQANTLKNLKMQLRQKMTQNKQNFSDLIKAHRYIVPKELKIEKIAKQELRLINNSSEDASDFFVTPCKIREKSTRPRKDPAMRVNLPTLPSKKRFSQTKLISSQNDASTSPMGESTLSKHENQKIERN
jgi:hypothetical protein